MREEEDCNDDLSDMLAVGDIRTRPDILAKIRLEVTPHMVMEPRFQSRPEDLEKIRNIAGYMFYIETQCEPPALMLMKVGKTDITSTIGMIPEIPPEFIQRAIDAPVDEPVHGMYAITDEIKEWLRKELGL